MMPLFSVFKKSQTHKACAIMLMSLMSVGMVSGAQAEGLGALFDTATTNSSQGKFLSVDQAFTVTPSVQGNQLTIRMNITPGHYIYRDKVKLSLPEGVTASELKFNQSSHFVNDPDFGRVAVFDQPQVTATASLTNSTAQALNGASLSVGWQGCAKAGLCYPPQKQPVTFSLPATDNKRTESSTQANDNKASANTSTNNKATNNTSPTSTPQNSTQKIPPAKVNSASTETAKVQASAVPSPVQSKTAANSSASQSGGERNSQSQNTDTPINGLSSIPATNNSEDATSLTQPNTLDGNEQEEAVIVQPELGDDILVQEQEATPANTQDIVTAEPEAGTSELENTLGNTDPFGLSEHPWLALGFLFLAGLGLAFTACVYPMIPIVANIVAHQHKPTALKGLLLTGGYALGVAVAYGVLGAIIAIFGTQLGIIGWLQNPVILLTFAAIFILLALYMLEAFTIRLPHMISNKLNAISQSADSKLGSFSGSFLAGALSALVISPCVSAPLFGALTAVSTIGSPVLGFAALFMLGLGLSSPLLLLGVTQGNFMPKAGVWMVWVKQGFALLLFAVALLLIERVFASALMLIAWGAWFMVVAMWAWTWRGRGLMFTRALGVIAGIWAGCLVIGAALGSDDSWQPLNRLIASNSAAVATTTSGSIVAKKEVNNTVTMTSLSELDGILSNHDKVLVDVTADWCIECRIMEKTLFTTPPAELADWQVVKLDVTETTDDSKAVFEHYQLFGPPALLYYVDGVLKVRQVGEIKRDKFEQTLQTL
ncbi:protein-disulfide reductase DsbD domain-containing protein [Psychrobacter sp. I-STPA6b]|uniref:cytochrome c biogenesis protein CcdA n=1 Tax=Psychrobacter sp. I-STPA6b TaxID=2585718 RepID=UPI001D0C10AC|nr:protein-disulfide reductase DsbD domain-containing protein [Psychrobacter sp. I-STPA6b]